LHYSFPVIPDPSMSLKVLFLASLLVLSVAADTPKDLKGAMGKVLMEIICKYRITVTCKTQIIKMCLKPSILPNNYQKSIGI
jgi:hypothetical protein